MKELQKHWTTLLGIVFFLACFIYLFKYSLDQEWIASQYVSDIKIGLGLAAGIGCVLTGAKFLQKKLQLVGELTAGFGVALLYATFSFAGIYDGLWNPMTVFLCMLAVTIAVCFFSYSLSLRILMNASLLGALLAPLVMRSEQDLVFTLFLYLLVLNTAYFFLSIRMRWEELRLIAFLGTWVLYLAYYVHFEPDVWHLPYRYAVAAFVFYLIAFVVSSWRDGQRFNGLNLYLGYINAVAFGLWSVVILTDSPVSYAVPLSIMGALYIAMAVIVYRLSGKPDVPVLTKFFGGVLLILIASSQLGSGSDMQPIVSVFIWCAVATLLLVIGKMKRLPYVQLLSVGVWLIIGLYWFVVTWDTPRGEWFGVYIPFLNWGGMAWIYLAALGFYYSLHAEFPVSDKHIRQLLGNTLSVLSHLIVGGLLKLQIQNTWDYKDHYTFLQKIEAPVALSIAWGIYAMLLFLWGSYSRQRLFRTFGSIVLGLVAVKALFFDLSGKQSLFKVLVLFLLGIISLTITVINNKWSDKDKSNPASPADPVDADQPKQETMKS